MNRLLVFTENYAKGGGNRYMVDLVNAVSSRFSDVVLLSNQGGVYGEDTERLNSSVVISSIPILSLSSLREYLIRWPRIIRALLLCGLMLLQPILYLYNITLMLVRLRRIRPSVVLACNGGYPAARAVLAAVIASRLARIPVIMSVVSMPTRRWRVACLYNRLFDMIIWRCANAVIVNAKAIAEALTGFRSAVPERIYVAHNGLDYCDVSVRHGRFEGGLTIGCVARMDWSKGAGVLFEAFRRVAGDNEDIRLEWIGYGDAYESLKLRAQFFKLGNRVSFPGHSSAGIHEKLQSFDLFAFPSLHEGLPYCVIEAMRAGCPIIASNVGGIHEIISDGQEGILVPPGDICALGEALARLCRNETLRTKMGEAARRRFLDELSLNKMQERVREIFGAVLSPSGVAFGRASQCARCGG